MSGELKGQACSVADATETDAAAELAALRTELLALVRDASFSRGIKVVRASKLEVLLDRQAGVTHCPELSGTCSSHTDVHAFTDECIGWRDWPPAFYRASIHTRHYEFEGCGLNEDEARQALRQAWNRHCAQVPEADPTLLTETDFLDAYVQTYKPGASYRDGEEFL